MGMGKLAFIGYAIVVSVVGVTVIIPGERPQQATTDKEATIEKRKNQTINSESKVKRIDDPFLKAKILYNDKHFLHSDEESYHPYIDYPDTIQPESGYPEPVYLESIYPDAAYEPVNRHSNLKRKHSKSKKKSKKKHSKSKKRKHMKSKSGNKNALKAEKPFILAQTFTTSPEKVDYVDHGVRSAEMKKQRNRPVNKETKRSEIFHNEAKVLGNRNSKSVRKTKDSVVHNLTKDLLEEELEKRFVFSEETSIDSLMEHVKDIDKLQNDNNNHYDNHVLSAKQSNMATPATRYKTYVIRGKSRSSLNVAFPQSGESPNNASSVKASIDTKYERNTTSKTGASTIKNLAQQLENRTNTGMISNQSMNSVESKTENNSSQIERSRIQTDLVTELNMTAKCNENSTSIEKPESTNRRNNSKGITEPSVGRTKDFRVPKKDMKEVSNLNQKVSKNTSSKRNNVKKVHHTTVEPLLRTRFNSYSVQNSFVNAQSETSTRHKEAVANPTNTRSKTISTILRPKRLEIDNFAISKSKSKSEPALNETVSESKHKTTKNSQNHTANIDGISSLIDSHIIRKILTPTERVNETATDWKISVKNVQPVESKEQITNAITKQVNNTSSSRRKMNPTRQAARLTKEKNSAVGGITPSVKQRKSSHRAAGAPTPLSVTDTLAMQNKRVTVAPPINKPWRPVNKAAPIPNLKVSASKPRLDPKTFLGSIITGPIKKTWRLTNKIDAVSRTETSNYNNSLILSGKNVTSNTSKQRTDVKAMQSKRKQYLNSAANVMNSKSNDSVNSFSFKHRSTIENSPDSAHKISTISSTQTIKSNPTYGKSHGQNTKPKDTPFQIPLRNKSDPNLTLPLDKQITSSSPQRINYHVKGKIRRKDFSRNEFVLSTLAETNRYRRRPIKRTPYEMPSISSFWARRVKTTARPVKSTTSTPKRKIASVIAPFYAISDNYSKHVSVYNMQPYKGRYGTPHREKTGTVTHPNRTQS